MFKDINVSIKFRGKELLGQKGVWGIITAVFACLLTIIIIPIICIVLLMDAISIFSKVTVKNKSDEEIRKMEKWIDEYVRSRSISIAKNDRTIFYFLRKKDAMAFKLRWI